jgi:hypothetical protein
MKIILLLLVLSLSKFAHAIPVVNENVANSGMITIYPDHRDVHRYYIAPNVVMIARNPKGVPYFVYDEYRQHVFTLVGVMQMTLVPAYTRADLEVAKAEILKKDSLAQFSGLPFIESSLSLTGSLPELIADNQCNHMAGLIGQEQSCTMVLTSKGRSLFINSIQRKTLFTTLQFAYSVQAVVRIADGTFKDQLIEHGIAVRIDGELLSQYPNIIRTNGSTSLGSGVQPLMDRNNLDHPPKLILQ